MGCPVWKRINMCTSKGRIYVTERKQYILAKGKLGIKDYRETPTCSEVNATSLGIAAIPFSLTSGNILKRAINIAYMLDMAPPGDHSKIVTFIDSHFA